MGSLKRYHAELVEDGGRGVAGSEFFRSAPYFQAERVSHTLLLEGERGSLRLPLLVRPIPGTGLFDASSPYGHPGGELAAPGPIDPDEVDWSRVPLVSVFVRDCVGEATCFTKGTLRVRSLIVDFSQPVQVRHEYAKQIRRNLRTGFHCETFSGPSAPEDARAALHRAYTETMERQGASARYFFSRTWFDSVLESPASFVLVCRARDGEPAAAHLAVRSDGYLHSFLGGSCDAYRALSPSKNTMQEKIALARSLGLPLHLGAGLKPGDGMEYFKRGFANATRPFYTHELVCDPEAYAELSRGIDAQGFFPAYRSVRERPVHPPPPLAAQQAAHA